MPWFRPTTAAGRKMHPIHAPSTVAAAHMINRGANLPIPGTLPHLMRPSMAWPLPVKYDMTFTACREVYVNGGYAVVDQ